MVNQRTIRIATRGSALALAQSNMVKAQCEAAFPDWRFELKIIKTTGDKLQTASMAQEGQSLPKGLFTKELEVALLAGDADLAVHSLKDLPTELPGGLKLGATGKREDVRDVLLYRDSRASEQDDRRSFGPDLDPAKLPQQTVVATSSTRRKAQLLTLNPGLKTPDIRGNVATRMQKLASQREIDATILALAGITRLQIRIHASGHIEGTGIPSGLLGKILSLEEMLPCVGQGAIGIEIRENDPVLEEVCARLNHQETMQCVRAERAFLAAMGGGCQSPVAAYAELDGQELRMRALSFASGPVRRAEGRGDLNNPEALGRDLAVRLK